jgi:hypothetical protein
VQYLEEAVPLQEGALPGAAKKNKPAGKKKPGKLIRFPPPL